MTLTILFIYIIGLIIYSLFIMEDWLDFSLREKVLFAIYGILWPFMVVWVILGVMFGIIEI